MSDTVFRNVRVDPSTPISGWPAEAIEILMDRGTLSDWRRLAAEIRRHPWGPVARTVEDIAGWAEHYGVDALMVHVIETARAEIDRQARMRYAKQIRSWRQGAGLTLRSFASVAGTSASRLSDYETGKVSPTTEVLGRLERVARAMMGKPSEEREIM